MNDMAQRISEVVAQSLAAGQAEVATLLDKVRDDIEALHRALGTLPGSAQQPVAKRSPVATGRRRRKKTEGCGKCSGSTVGIEQDPDEAYAPREDPGRA